MVAAVLDSRVRLLIPVGNEDIPWVVGRCGSFPELCDMGIRVMNKYTIRYWYGSYEGTREVYADDEDEAIRKMWRMLRKDMTLPMAYQSEEIIDVEYNAE